MIGETILHYKIIEKLGEGGMGVVYKAEDTKLKRNVAIKFLPRFISSNKEEQQRFEIEAQAAASLNNPNISTIHAIENANDQVFIVMEFIDGFELKEKLKAGPIPVSETLNIAKQIAQGLETAHSKGIIHRDIKSSNIMITKNGNVKIMDFGLAKIGHGTEITKIGTTIGTTAYMSPEQTRGETVNQQTDIWSFGIILYEMLTGELPFQGEYDQAIIYSINNIDYQPVTNYSGSEATVVDRILKKCLEKNQADRYKTVSDILKDFELPGEENQSVGKNVKSKLANKKYTRKKIFALTGFTIGIIILSFLVPAGWQKIKELVGWDSAPKVQHLLILPFVNIGNDQSKQAFCDGLMETLVSKLTQLEQYAGSLWVVPASEVIRNKIKSPNEAYQMFGVNLAVTGSLQFMNKIYRLTLNLVDAKNMRQLNSSVIDIKEKDLFSLQDNSVINLLEMLNIQLVPELKDVLKAGRTKIPEAYAQYVQGRGYLLRYENIENIDEAVNSFKMSTESDTVYSLAYAGLGEAYWRKFEITKNTELVKQATQLCQRAFRLDSLLSPINVTLGIIYTGTGKYNDAIKHFNKALSNDPLNASAYRGLAKAYESQGKNNEAEITFKRAIKLKPEYWAGYNDLGVLYYKNGKYEHAIQQFKKVIELTPDNYRGYNNLGGIYYMLERRKEAREMFERSLSIRKSYNILTNLGTLYYIERKFDDAAKTYLSALELNDKDYLTWGNLAAAYFGIPDKKEKAIETYKRAIEIAEKQLKINPNDAELISNLAAYYADIGNKKNSQSLLEKSLKIAPDDVQVIYRAATTYEQLGSRDKALQWLSLAIRKGYSKTEIESQPELKELVADTRYKNIITNFENIK